MQRSKRNLFGGLILTAVLTLAAIVFVLAGIVSPGASELAAPIHVSEKDRNFSGTDGGLGAWEAFESAEERLEHYLDYSKYPDFSRPLEAGHTDLLDPYRSSQLETPLVQGQCLSGAAGRGCDSTKLFLKVRCTIRAESVMAIRRTDFAFNASCTDTDSEQKLDLSKFTANVLLEKNTPAGEETVRRPGPIFFGDDGSNGDAVAGDRVYRLIVRLGLHDWGWMQLTLAGEYGGAAVTTLASVWFSTPHRVAEFGETIIDGVQLGHLIVRVPVQIYKAGYYEFNANLLQADEDREPVANSYTNIELTEGRHIVELKFFGKVIRDKGLDGPFVVTALRARRNNAPVTPADLQRAALADRDVQPREDILYQPMFEYVPIGPEHVTAPYGSDEFSAAEWTSEEKTVRLARLRDEVAQAN